MEISLSNNNNNNNNNNNDNNNSNDQQSLSLTKTSSSSTTPLDFFELLSRNQNHRPAKITQIIVREQARPSKTTPVANNNNNSNNSYRHHYLWGSTGTTNSTTTNNNDHTNVNEFFYSTSSTIDDTEYDREFRLQELLTGNYYQNCHNYKSGPSIEILEDEEDDDNAMDTETISDNDMESSSMTTKEKATDDKMEDSEEEKEEDMDEDDVNDANNNNDDDDNNMASSSFLWQKQEEENYRMARNLAFELLSRTKEFKNHTQQPSLMDEDDLNTYNDNINNAMIQPLSSNVATTTKEQRTFLEQKRKEMEQKLSTSLHEVELADWETSINWDGIEDTKNDDNNNKNNKNSLSESDNILSIYDYNNDNKKYKNQLAASAEQSTDLLLSHPFNLNLDAVDFSKVISWEGFSSTRSNNRFIRNVPLILQYGVAGRSVARLTAPCGRPEPFSQSLVFDQRMERSNDPRRLLSFSHNKNSLARDKVALEKLIAEKQKKRAQMAIDKTGRVKKAMGKLGLGPGRGRAITSSLMGPGGTERTGRPSRHGGAGNGAHDSEHVEQLEMITNHTLVKPDLKKTELRQFHRPRIPKSVVKKEMYWQFQVRVFPQNKRRSAADGSTVVGSYHSIMAPSHSMHSKIRNETDLSPAHGNLVLLEYSEERPPLQLSKGMACRIKNYYRGDRSKCPISAGGGDRPIRKRNLDAKEKGRKDTNNNSDGSLVGKFQKPPRLNRNSNQPTTALDLIGKIPSSNKQKNIGASSSTGGGGADGAAINKKNGAANLKKKNKEGFTLLPEGVTECLHDREHGPFIGEIEQGTTQTGLISNLFVAPMFLHKSEPTDFLMVLGQKPGYKQSNHGDKANPNNSLAVVLRPLPPSTFCVGQIEPRVKVFAPQTTLEKSFTVPFVTYQIAKALQRTQRGLRFDEINDRLFANTDLLPNALRQRIKQVAQYDKNTQIWTLKDVGFEDFPGVPILGMRFSPEGVAAYEAECCAVQRLKDLGICELFSGSNSVTSVGAAMVYLNGALNAARERKSLMRRMVEVAKRSKSNNKTKNKQIALYERAADKLEAAWKEIRRKQEIARFIYEELQLAPWNLTAEFIDVHKQAQGTGMMRLTGLGDPSGLGEAYNFLREVDAKPNKGTGNSDGALNAQIKKITGTENDLRKLTMKQMASLLRSYGMPQKEIDKLKRWDRVHVIREFSTRAASNGMGDGLEGYARGEKMKLSDQKQMYRDRIQEIWRRQRAALSTDAVPSEATRVGNMTDSGDAITDGDGANLDTKNLDSNLAKEMDDSDSDSADDDDYAATFEDDFLDVQQTNQLVADQIRGDSDGPGTLAQRANEELSMDARELAALKRQREEERAAQEGINVSKADNDPDSHRAAKTKSVDRKVIRKKITKIHPDGTQTTTFKFIVQQEEVDKIISNMKRAEKEKGSRKHRGKGTILENGFNKSRHSKKLVDDSEKRFTGHSMFEEEDDSDYGHHRTNIKLQFKKKTRVVTTKTHKRTNSSSLSTKSMPKLKKTPKNQNDKKLKASREKKLKRRRREMEEADLYRSSAQRRGTNNRRERGSARERMPHVKMADRLEQIRMQVEKRPGSVPFHRPVNRRTLPKYYVVISQPIDLQSIRDKNQRYEYKTADSFIREFDLMKNNAIKFNGIDSIIGKEATSIYEFVKETVDQHRDQFNDLEQAVSEQLNNGRKSKKSKSSTPKSGQSSQTNEKKKNSSPSMNTVMLDGVATTLNVGDLSSYALGGGDSDSDISITKIPL